MVGKDCWAILFVNTDDGNSRTEKLSIKGLPQYQNSLKRALLARIVVPRCCQWPYNCTCARWPRQVEVYRKFCRELKNFPQRLGERLNRTR
jgi:hypothetical protein